MQTVSLPSSHSALALATESVDRANGLFAACRIALQPFAVAPFHRRVDRRGKARHQGSWSSDMFLMWYVCGGDIQQGEPHLSLEYNIAHTDPDWSITVEHSESLLTACVDCAPGRDAIVTALKSGGLALRL